MLEEDGAGMGARYIEPSEQATEMGVAASGDIMTKA